MKATHTIMCTLVLMSAMVHAAPPWVAITNAIPTAPANAVWNDFTDFVPDMDASPDGWLYLKLWREGNVPWDKNPTADAQGRTYVYRAPANLTTGDYAAAWQQVMRFAANAEAGHKVSLAKRDGAFIGSNFAARHDVGGGWDWSFMSYYVTNALGQPVIRSTNNDAPDVIYAPGNLHPYAVSQIAGFAQFDYPTNYVAITTSADLDGQAIGHNIANIEGRKIGGGTPWGFGPGSSTFARVETDGKYKAWSRGVAHGDNVYIWKGPSSDTTDDGIWVVPDVMGLTTTEDIGAAISNAYNIIPVASMGASITWETSDAVGIVAFGPNENVNGTDLIVISMNIDGDGKIFAFNPASPGGPVTLFGQQNLMPPGADPTRLQLGKAGRFLFVMSGSDAGTRVLYRLDMLGSIAPEPQVTITTTNQTVSSTVTDITVAGTSAGEVSGMWYYNAANDATDAIIISPNWSASIPLALGVNEITVSATNSAGIMAQRHVTILRQDPGQGTPVVSIVNGDAQLYEPATSYALSGTANTEVYGDMWWTNLTTGTSGSMPAAPNWTVTVTGLITGANQIVVYGSNLIDVVANDTTLLHLGYNYYINFIEIGLPPGIGIQDRNASIGSDGTHIFVSRCHEDDPMYRLPWWATNYNQWVEGAAFPALEASNETGNGFGYRDGYIYTFAQCYPGDRTVVRYDINGDAWEVGPDVQVGANTSCVLDDDGNIYGGWRGWDQVQQNSPFPVLTNLWQEGLGGGANHSWSSTRSETDIYFMKGWGTQNGRIFSIPADGTATSVFTFVTQTPWPIGLGCAVEYVPALYSRHGRPELWVLRGQGDGPTSDGQGGNPTPDLAIYDIEHGLWTRYTLNLLYEEGAGMTFAEGWLFVMNGWDESLARTETIPEPGVVGVLFLTALLIRKRI